MDEHGILNRAMNINWQYKCPHYRLFVFILFSIWIYNLIVSIFKELYSKLTIYINCF
jgi:hypothetical protein